jgi:hypothetical protein
MRDETQSVEQITLWRNLLDAFGQLSAAWEIAEQAQRTASAGSGPGALHMPREVVHAFTRAGNAGAQALVGLAEVLGNQHGNHDIFSPALDALRSAQRHWATAYTTISSAGERDEPLEPTDS